jgi:hypothetical protein
MSVNPRARGFIKVDSPSAALPAERQRGILAGARQRSTRAESPASPEISPKEIYQTVFG